ncbi:MAG: hypothetical protein FJ090_03545 [Deltaproteobacteria bacterium]|nr:hypothetical protein [Deltaproteobacteria bacterium]
MPWLTPLAFAGEPDPYMTGCHSNDRALVAAHNDAVEALDAGAMKATRTAMDEDLKRSPKCKGAPRL